ncbi:MAG: acetate kinase [Cyanobacteriota bacterium]|nr:acetate kinase [Cyanobacteriota bacterium]
MTTDPALSDQLLVLVLNAGSSSLKASLLAPGLSLDAMPVQWSGRSSWQLEHSGAVEALLDDWLAPQLAHCRQRIQLVGHRVVHGGERFNAPAKLDQTALTAIEALIPLAPLHNGPAVRVMRWIRNWLPEAEHWACFDTAFHASIPPELHTYALPEAWRSRGLRRFGFHGLNHQHVAASAAALNPAARRLISCHLGAGCSLCAILLPPGGQPRSLATTMGFTPLEGLVMATRSGSVDPGLLLHLLQEGMPVSELEQGLNHNSGLLGLSELSGSMEELRSAAARGHTGARLAIGVFEARLIQQIGAMAASLGGVDVIALSGGIGEHDQALLQRLRQLLGWLGRVTWLVVPADEEGVIARSCLGQRSLQRRRSESEEIQKLPAGSSETEGSDL